VTRFVRVLAALALAAFFAPHGRESLASLTLEYGRLVARDVVSRVGSPVGSREVEELVATAADRVTFFAAASIPLAALVLIVWPNRRRLALSLAAAAAALSAFIPLVVGFRLNQSKGDPVWMFALAALPFGAAAVVGCLTGARRVATYALVGLAMVVAVAGLAYIFTTQSVWAPPAFAPAFLVAAAWLELPATSDRDET
jgi:hypothetical protein